VNLYPADDPLAGPVRPIAPTFARAVLKDACLMTGPTWQTAPAPFLEASTQTIIARKLALDWIAFSGRLPEGEQRVYDAAYDDALTV
jgi:hypothetical protein